MVNDGPAENEKSFLLLSGGGGRRGARRGARRHHEREIVKRRTGRGRVGQRASIHVVKIGQLKLCLLESSEHFIIRVKVAYDKANIAGRLIVRLVAQIKMTRALKLVYTFRAQVLVECSDGFVQIDAAARRRCGYRDAKIGQQVRIQLAAVF